MKASESNRLSLVGWTPSGPHNAIIRKLAELANCQSRSDRWGVPLVLIIFGFRYFSDKMKWRVSYASRACIKTPEPLWGKTTTRLRKRLVGLRMRPLRGVDFYSYWNLGTSSHFEGRFAKLVRAFEKWHLFTIEIIQGLLWPKQGA